LNKYQALFLYDIKKSLKETPMAKILVPLATGFEEIEAVTIIDLLRRASNHVVTCSLQDTLEVSGAHFITIQANATIKSVLNENFDMIVLPGGGQGTQNLASNKTVQELLKKFKVEKKLIPAICAAPYALHTAGVLNKKYTCYPSFEKKIGETGYCPNEDVVIDGNVITSKGPSTAMSFALELVKLLNGQESFKQLKTELLIKHT
jgi:4-methyl-5(b-hydroxyethyl)-thiazole monophosphate biosynthesis